MVVLCGGKINKLWLHSYNGIILNNKKKWTDIHSKKKCTIFKKNHSDFSRKMDCGGEQENGQTN